MIARRAARRRRRSWPWSASATPTHRWVMHGPGMGWHRSHHRPPAGPVRAQRPVPAVLLGARRGRCSPLAHRRPGGSRRCCWVGVGVTRLRRWPTCSCTRCASTAGCRAGCPRVALPRLGARRAPGPPPLRRRALRDAAAARRPARRPGRRAARPRPAVLDRGGPPREHPRGPQPVVALDRDERQVDRQAVGDQHDRDAGGGFHSTNSGPAAAASQWPSSARRVSTTNRSRPPGSASVSVPLADAAGEQRAGLGQPVLPAADPQHPAVEPPVALEAPARGTASGRRSRATGSRWADVARCRRGQPPGHDVDQRPSPGRAGGRRRTLSASDRADAAVRPRHVRRPRSTREHQRPDEQGDEGDAAGTGNGTAASTTGTSRCGRSSQRSWSGDDEPTPATGDHGARAGRRVPTPTPPRRRPTATATHGGDPGDRPERARDRRARRRAGREVLASSPRRAGRGPRGTCGSRRRRRRPRHAHGQPGGAVRAGEVHVLDHLAAHRGVPARRARSRPGGQQARPEGDGAVRAGRRRAKAPVPIIGDEVGEGRQLLVRPARCGGAAAPTGARPAGVPATSRASASGASHVSASRNSRWVPVAALGADVARPRLARASPCGSGGAATTVAPRRAATAAVPSVEPSSTTITSCGAGIERPAATPSRPGSVARLVAGGHDDRHRTRRGAGRRRRRSTARAAGTRAEQQRHPPRSPTGDEGHAPHGQRPPIDGDPGARSRPCARSAPGPGCVNTS